MPRTLTWSPVLGESPPALADRLLAALDRDIRSGALAPGLRLPPHRELAFALGISVGTVTKAYAEAERRGLVHATVGRGTFVAAPGADAAFRFSPRGLPAGVNLAQNVRPILSSHTALADALGRLRRKDLTSLLAYGPCAGEEAHRRALAAWLDRTTLLQADWRRLMVTAGGQQALTLALGALAAPGDAVMTEAGTYYGLRTLAEQAGYRLKGLAMDREGLLPEALDRAAATTGARIVYVTPTLHNPTGRTMGRARREEIARVARERDLWIVEDDVYALYDSARSLPPLAALAPERTFYVSSLSKALSAGLRVGILSTPGGDGLERVMRAMRATLYAPPALGPAVAAQWIEDGAADALAVEVKAEMGRRTRLALRILGGAAEPPAAAGSLHIWLPMSELDAERAAAHALRSGVELTPPSAPIVDGQGLSGLRVCLGGVEDIADLERALQVVAGAVGGQDRASAMAMV
ncbi:MAG: transcriptional regulator, GntR family with aminotransferase domain [Caulobacteraceae bacterium]|nr:transcriptional regulator, GntR family with aminotransferase domain [Caulobacteraceae bacterium]